MTPVNGEFVTSCSARGCHRLFAHRPWLSMASYKPSDEPHGSMMHTTDGERNRW